MTNKKLFATLVKTSAALLLLTPAIGQTEEAQAGTESLTGNVTATSTYIWRGLAQTSEAALQGGMQFNMSNGAYAGAWTSTVLGGSEIDVYGGYKGKADLFNYDAGVIAYHYPNDAVFSLDLNFVEIYADISRDFYGAKVSISSDVGTYLEGYATIPVEHWNLGLHVGRYSIEKDYPGFGPTAVNITEDYFDFRVAMGKDVGGYEVEFAVADTNLSGTNGDFRTSISVSKDFTP